MACLTFSVTFLSTLFSACFLENSAYYLLLSPNSMANSTLQHNNLEFSLAAASPGPSGPAGPLGASSTRITQGHQGAPCGSLLCLSQGEQLCCEAKAELMINYVHLCYPGFPPCSRKCSHGSSRIGVLGFGCCSHTFPNVWILVPMFFLAVALLKRTGGFCTLPHALAHTLTSLLIAAEKLDRPSARRCLVSPV